VFLCFGYIMDIMPEYILDIVGLLLGAFIAYHIYFLSKRISNQSKLEHKDMIKRKANNLLVEIQKEGLRRKAYLVNINRYFKDYPSNQEKLGSGYSHIKAEIKATRYNGLEFFCEMPKQINAEEHLVYPVGLVPYEWIEYIDEEGDEYEGVPIFYCNFKGKVYWKKWWRRWIPFGYPYRNLLYYKKSDNYREGSDPSDMEWMLVRVKE